MSFLISHSTIEFDIWALLALLLCVAVGLYWYYGMRKLNKEKKALEEAAAAEFDEAGTVRTAEAPADSGETKA